MGLRLYPGKMHVSSRDVKIKSQLYASITHSKFVAVDFVVLDSAGFLMLTTELKFM